MAIEIKNFQGKVLHVVDGNTLKGADLHGLDLRGADLHGLDLRGANLGGADLGSANFGSANLEKANLKGADFLFTYLEGANLRGAYLRGVDLHSGKLWGANLEGANLEDANLEKAHLEKANLKKANLKKANLREAASLRADLEGANLQGADLWQAELWSANLRGANLRGTNLQMATLMGASLQGADLQGAELQRADLREADFTGANIKGVKFSEAFYVDKAIGLEGITTGRMASQLEREWGPTLVKQASGRVLAKNHYSTTWDDMAQDTHYYAEVVLDPGDKLRLTVTIITSGPYVQGGEKIDRAENLNIGTLQAPKLGLVRSTIVKYKGYKWQKFSQEWTWAEGPHKGQRAPLSTILAEVAGEQASQMPSGTDPRVVDGQRAAIMTRLDELNPEQVKSVFNFVMKMKMASGKKVHD